MEEIWKPLKGYEKLYEISNFGRRKRLDNTIIDINGIERHFKEKILINNANNSAGYVNVTLTKNGIKSIFSQHRLVAEHFVNNPRNLNIVNHIDEDRANNHASNLEWVTHAENLAHRGAFQRGREKIKKKVYQYDLENNLVGHYSYAGETKLDDFNSNLITQVCLGYKKTHKNFIWSYKLL